MIRIALIVLVAADTAIAVSGFFVTNHLAFILMAVVVPLLVAFLIIVMDKAKDEDEAMKRQREWLKRLPAERPVGWSQDRKDIDLDPVSLDRWITDCGQ